MKNSITRLLSILLVIIGTVYAQRFTAYYDKISDDYPITEMVNDKLFGRYADLFVEVNKKGVLQFTRKTSYLPVWNTGKQEYTFDELVGRKGDGRDSRPDIISKYSYVRLIKNDPTGIIVHWRYFPDFNNVDWDGVVDEYFKIKPDGRIYRSVKRGTKKYLDWISPGNTVNITYQLSAEGIKMVSNMQSKTSQGFDYKPVNRSVYNKRVKDTVLRFSFDEGIVGYSEITSESVSRTEYPVKGPYVYWKEGVSASALHFDGYYSAIEIDDGVLSEGNNFSVDGWLALAAYPFGWAPIIQQSCWGEQGFYFGINEDGFPGIHLAINGQWVSLVDSSQIPLFQWTHLAAVFSGDEKCVKLYVNGQPVSYLNFVQGDFTPRQSVLTIGLNHQKMPAIKGRIQRGKWPSLFGIEGLLDEISLYARALTPKEIENIYNGIKDIPEVPDMQKRELPDVHSVNPPDTFAACYTTLNYYETWDNLWRVGDFADVVVSFDTLPVNLVSWRGISYGQYFVSENGKWIGDQSNEDYRHIRHPGEAEGCLEHMSDKQCRHSHVRIIENTDARIVIHWRYGLVDSRYYFAPGVDGWGGWTDEYWTIYPDGVAVRHLPRGIVFGDGWVETMFLSAPGTKPEDNVYLQAFSVLNAKGEMEKLSWEKDSPRSKLKDPLITMVNSKSEYKMFNIFPVGSSIEIFGGHNKRSHFHWWNHWPVSQITSDGRGARAADRIAHSSLSWGAPSKNYLMYGMTNKDINTLLPLAASWNNPPVLTKLDGVQNAQYIPEERAYHMDALEKNIAFYAKASALSPLVNPAFVINNWRGEKPRVHIDGTKVSAKKEYRYGLVATASGQKLVLWFKGTLVSQTHFLLQ